MNIPSEDVASALKIVADECSSVAALIDVHDDYRIIWANRQLKEFLKTAAVAPERMRWDGMCPFAFRIGSIKVMEEVVRTGQPAHVEEQPCGTRISTRLSETMYWNWKVLPAPTESCPGCVLVMAENVTDRVAPRATVNAHLFEQVGAMCKHLDDQNLIADNERELLIAVLDAMPEAVAVVDTRYRVVHANDAARKLYLASEGEELSLIDLVGRTHARMIDGHEMASFEHPLALAVRGEEFQDFEYIIENEGETLYRSVSGAAVRDSEGNVTFGVAIGRDVTEQKRTQAALESSLQRERRIAQTLQNALMAELPPSMDGFRMAGIYDAGLREAEIGGDFFDIFTPADGKLAIVIGDVAGKGLSAAIQIAAAKYGLRSYAYEDPSPAHVVSLLNDAMYLDPPIGGFVTLFYGVIDVTTQVMTYSNAGHEPPLLRRGDGTVESLFSNGIVLGVAQKTDYDERTVAMESSDRLLLYTDGITEARKENGDMLGDERLLEYWSACGSSDASDAAENVYHWAKEFSEGHFHDDVAIVVISKE